MIESQSLMSVIDETYIGARKPRKLSADKDGNGDYPKNKILVIGILQIGGKVFVKMQSALKFVDLKKTAKQLIDFDNTVLITDNFKNCASFKNCIEHHMVNHSVKEYAPITHNRRLLEFIKAWNCWSISLFKIKSSFIYYILIATMRL